MERRKSLTIPLEKQRPYGVPHKRAVHVLPDRAVMKRNAQFTANGRRMPSSSFTMALELLPCRW